MSRPKGALEVHEHHIITGPHAHHAGRNHIEHSHEGGDVPHVHDDGISETGPAARTIDKDEWFAATGLQGGGRKKFTVKPAGPQMPMRQTKPSEIEVVIVGDGGASVANGSEGGAKFTLARMLQTFDARVVSVTHVPGRRSA